MRLFAQRSPLEQINLASAGGQAETVKNVLGPALQKEADSILSQLSTCKPELASYAHLAGQAQMLKKLLTSINMTLDEARELGEKLRREGL